LADWKFRNRKATPTKTARISDFNHAVEIDVTTLPVDEAYRAYKLALLFS
jgi:hypothetical protein